MDAVKIPAKLTNVGRIVIIIGRIALFEMFEMNNEIRDLVFAKAPTTELKKAVKASGMRTLMEDGRLKVFKGTTTPAEVVRITQTEEKKMKQITSES